MRAATPPRRSAMVTRSWAWRATNRDLRRSTRILGCAATLKTKKTATATVKTKKPARASQGAGKGKILEPSELWKLKKYAFEAKDLWKERDDPGALERWKAEEEARAAVEEVLPPKKRKRLVTRRLPDALIYLMKTQPYLIKPISAEELADIEKRSYGYTETYLMRKFIDDKMYAYEQALINQYDIMGYAEDVSEASDDEQEELRVVA